VEDGFEPVAGGGVGKHKAGEFVTAEPAIRPNNLRAKGVLDFREGGLAGLNDFASEEVGIHDIHAAVAEQAVAGGFAHADAAGEAQDSHVRQNSNVQHPESEGRNPKAEIRRKSEGRRPKPEGSLVAFGLRPSDFGLRISSFRAVTADG
jgi:hypothetical protein